MHDYLDYASDAIRDTFTVTLDVLCEKNEEIFNEIRSNVCKHYLEKTDCITPMFSHCLRKDVSQAMNNIISRKSNADGLAKAVLLGIEDTKRIRILIAEELQDEEYNVRIESCNASNRLEIITCFHVAKEDQDAILRKINKNELPRRLFRVVDKVTKRWFINEESY